MSNSSIRLIDGILSDATTPGQNGFGSDANERVLRIPTSYSITGASLSDCLMSYPGHSFGITPLQRCSRYILQPQPTVYGNFCKGLMSNIQ